MSAAGQLSALGPCRLWTLRDMVENFRVNAIRLIQTELGVLIRMSDDNQRFVEKIGGYNPELLRSPEHLGAVADAVQGVQSLIEMSTTVCRDMKCVHINHAIDALGWWLKYDSKNWSDLKFKSIALRDSIDVELKEYLYYQYPKTKGQKLLFWKTEWEATISSFPSSEIDIFSATDCYAMGHDTAAVFHCMRVLEHGLAAMAADVGLTFDVQQWHTIIEQIEAKIAEQRKTLARGLEKNARLQFLSEAAKEFFYFKDGWRNYVSHNRGRYDEHQSLSPTYSPGR